MNADYLKTLKERAQKSKVYRKYQLVGLEIAKLLSDERHKSLYIKLAKNYDNQELLGIAKDVSERKNIENKGGYFMTIIKRLKEKNDKTENKSINNRK